MNAWEYRTIRLILDDDDEWHEFTGEEDSLPINIDELLNRYGGEGWEVVAVIADSLSMSVTSESQHFGSLSKSSGSANGPTTVDGYHIFLKRQLSA